MKKLKSIFYININSINPNICSLTIHKKPEVQELLKMHYRYGFKLKR